MRRGTAARHKTHMGSRRSIIPIIRRLCVFAETKPRPDCWKLSKECEEVQQIAKDSGLYPLVENYVKPDSLTVNCFVERYHGEIDTMHFPFGEMAFIPEDAQNILGLSVIGK
ncbi:hypothetical protein C5167_044066 [Papaver somniferum]|uniref:Aminotransferase-like plant mobile domain-containing protein n=1 Tax=Papaver somniferum TaxID=3469 RepID=A0A4Y7LAF5_PAPSO|nr:hypothetical protein C5167_044066 [Papaver somniferum]